MIRHYILGLKISKDKKVVFVLLHVIVDTEHRPEYKGSKDNPCWECENLFAILLLDQV